MAKKQVSVELGNTYAHVIVGSKNSISDYGTITVHEDHTVLDVRHLLWYY